MEGNLTLANLSALPKHVEPKSVIQDICCCNDRKKLDDLLELLDDCPYQEVELALKDTQLCDPFLKKLASLKVEYLLTALFSYKLPEKSIQQVAHFERCKQRVFDYIIRMTSDPEDKILLLQACVNEGTSLNAFFKTRTGFTGFLGLGIAKDKLTRLRGLLSYLQMTYPPEQKVYKKTSTGSLDDDQEPAHPKVEEVNATASETSMTYMGSTMAYLELCAEYAIENPCSTIAILICVISSGYYYMNDGSELEEAQALTI